MVGHRIALTAIALLTLAAGAGRLLAEEERGKAEGARPDRLESLAAKLGLDAQQKEQVHKIESDFHKKAEPLEQRLWSLHREEFAAMRKTLSEDQRAKLPEVIKSACGQELQAISDKLGLSDDQKQRLMKIRQEYEPKFRALMDEKAETGAAGFKQFRELRFAAHRAMREVLTEDQRAKVPGILREEFQKWQDPTARREMLGTIADKLGLSNDQKEQLRKIQADYNRQMEEPTAQFKQMHHEEHEAIEKVLTPEQRTKFEDMMKTRVGKGQEK